MMKRSLSLVAVLFALALCAGAAGAQEKRGPSTPEERQRAVQIATLLENEPLHKDAKKLSQALLFFLIEVPDISVPICTDVLGDYSKIKGDYAPTITGQLTFSTAKFIIEYPEQAALGLDRLDGVEVVAHHPRERDVRARRHEVGEAVERAPAAFEPHALHRARVAGHRLKAEPRHDLVVRFLQLRHLVEAAAPDDSNLRCRHVSHRIFNLTSCSRRPRPA